MVDHSDEVAGLLFCAGEQSAARVAARSLGAVGGITTGGEYMAFNRFERDRGEVACGDCAVPLGYRIDTEPGTVTLLCKPCYLKRIAEDAPPAKVITRTVTEHVGLTSSEDD